MALNIDQWYDAYRTDFFQKRVLKAMVDKCINIAEATLTTPVSTQEELLKAQIKVKFATELLQGIRPIEQQPLYLQQIIFYVASKIENISDPKIEEYVGSAIDTIVGARIFQEKKMTVPTT